MDAYPHISTRHLCPDKKTLLPIILLLWLTGAGAQPNAGIKQLISPVSIIEIPVRLSLEPLSKAAEEALPQQAGNWRSWKDWHGIKSKYRAWRGPLSITIAGDTLLVQAHIRYWIRAHKKVLGAINLEGSCGINESPRQALIGMQVRMGWGTDWTLRPRFHILPTRFLDRCEMTIANIDVTPLVEKEFRKQMQESLRTALRTLAPGMDAIRKQAQQTWLLLQEPVELGQGSRLLFRPVGVALSGITGWGNNIDAQLAVSLRPALLTGTEALGEPVPLPPLQRYYPHSTGLNLQLVVDLDFATLNQKLSSALSGKSFNIYGLDARINQLAITGSGEVIRTWIELAGDVAGTIEVLARLVYNAEGRKLELQDLTFNYDAKSSAAGLMEQTFHEHVRQSMEDAANEALTRHLDLLVNRLETALKKILPANVLLELSGLQPGSMQIDILEQGIRLDGTATGTARLMLR